MFPEDAGYYFSKIQCFCFNQQVLNSKEELQMPLYFYMEPEIDNDPLLRGVREIKIIYKFYKAKNQDMAVWMQNQQKWEYEQKAFLRNKRREKLVKEGLSVADLDKEEAEEKVLLQSSNPEYKIGDMRPNQITEFKTAL